MGPGPGPPPRPLKRGLDSVVDFLLFLMMSSRDMSKALDILDDD